MIESTIWILTKKSFPKNFPVLGIDGFNHGYCLVSDKTMMKHWNITHWASLPKIPKQQNAKNTNTKKA